MSVRLDNTKPERTMIGRLRALSHQEFARLVERAHKAARKAGALYGGKVLPFSLMPFLIDDAHHQRLRAVCNALLACLKMVPELYLADREVRAVLPLTPGEDEWLRDLWTGDTPRFESCIARFDADWASSRKNGIDQLQFFEVNAVAAGGFFYEPSVAKVLADVVFPAVFDPRERRHLRHDLDLRDMLEDAMTAQLRAVGGAARSIGVLDQDPGDGDWEEVPEIVRELGRRGWRAAYLDPREIVSRPSEIHARGKKVEVFYRYIQLRDMLGLPGKQGRFNGIREAFRQGRVVPGLCGDFDHKSLWELFQSERFAKLFPTRLRNRFADSIPWTRLLRDARTDGPWGDDVDLLPFVRRNQELLVMKPNRELGGKGIIFGSRTSAQEWARQLDQALRTEFGWVVQSRIFAHRKLVPAVRRHRLEPQPMYFTQGIFCDGRDIATFGRLCPRPVVNVARGGLAAPGFVWR